MNLENVTVELRPRTEWEAVDLGARMVRRDAAAIYGVWFAVTLPLVALAVLATVFTPYATLAIIVYWWLEPVADGPILRIISRRLFGEDANVRSALKSMPYLVRRNWIFLLTPYRFHFARSTAMPVTQLEGLRGTARRKRAKVLNQRILNYGMGVTVAYEHLVLALYFGVILIMLWLVPTTYQDSIGMSWAEYLWYGDTRAGSVISLLVFYIAQSALQPWFVGTGFGLYINCRTQLEAWDIEVAFRRMVQRRAGGLATAILLLTAIALPGFLLSPPARAQDAGEPPAEEAPQDPGIAGFWTDEDIGPALDVVLAHEALQTEREVETWQSIEASDDTDRVEADGDWLRDLVDAVSRVGGFIAESGLWIAVGLLLLLVVATRRLWLPYLDLGPGARPESRRIVLAGGEISADELPDDVPGEASRLWRTGRKRQALSLLYRGSVLAAVSNYGVRLPDSATEGACVAAVDSQTGGGRADYFRRVVMAWVGCAYGFRDPDDATAEPLFREWASHFGGAT